MSLYKRMQLAKEQNDKLLKKQEAKKSAAGEMETKGENALRSSQPSPTPSTKPFDRNKYQQEYMVLYRAAKKLGITVPEYRARMKGEE